MYGSWSTAHANFLSSLSPDELNALMERARKVRLQKRQQLFAAGERAKDVYLVYSGCMKLYQLSPGGKEIILWFSFPGELFGVAETVRNSRREIFAEANTPSEILVVAHNDFVEFLRDNPQVAFRAIGILSARVRTLGTSLVDMAADDVETRLVRLLLRFAAGALPDPCSTPRRDGETCINIGATHNDLANLIGASRQTVTSALTGFRQRGLIRLVERHVHILEADRMRQLLEDN